MYHFFTSYREAIAFRDEHQDAGATLVGWPRNAVDVERWIVFVPSRAHK